MVSTKHETRSTKQIQIFNPLNSKKFSNFEFRISNLNHGYVALSSILIISAVILVIGISVSLLAVSEGQLSLGEKKNEETVDFVEGCVEDALLKLNEDSSIPSTITVPEGTCSVVVNSQSGNDWTFTVSGTQDSHTKNIQVSATRDTTVTVTSWKAIE